MIFAGLFLAHSTSFVLTAAMLVLCCAIASTSSPRPLGDDAMAVILAASGFMGALVAHLCWFSG